LAKSYILAAAFSALSLPALAGSLLVEPDPVLIAPEPAPESPSLVFTLFGGVSGQPTYFGSSELEARPSFGFSLDLARLPWGRSIGNADPDAENYGFTPRGSFRVISERDSDESPELAGLNKVDTAVEVGLGLGYAQRHFEAFADVRYGVTGHKSFVGELGADAVFKLNDQFTVKLGPRLLAGSGRYADTYFGVTAAEAASSSFDAFDASGGLLTAGIELGATYKLNKDWGIDGALRWDKFTGSAEDSPIVAQGRDSNVSLRLGLTRRVSLSF
jgi:outer membrane protein